MKRLYGCVLVLLVLLSGLAPASANEAGPRISAQEALDRLNSGNARFSAGVSQPVDLSTGRREELSHGQYPFAVIIACADSRVASAASRAARRQARRFQERIGGRPE
ncbi:MAG: hypothetical protein WD042_09080 [Phycisphaeraceae bacterium]